MIPPGAQFLPPGSVTNRAGADLAESLRRVRLLAMDVDGVMTDAGMYYGENGEELKKFNTRDGHGIALVHELGLRTAILTREDTRIVERRGKKLGVHHVRVGIKDKLPVLRQILDTEGMTLNEVCYIGDDVNDLDVLRSVGVAVVVQDATRHPRALAHYITAARGGDGAVREVCELILDVHRGNDQ